MLPPIKPIASPIKSLNLTDLSTKQNTTVEVSMGFSVVTRTPPTPARPICVDLK